MYDERYTFSGGTFFALMKEQSLYETDFNSIKERVDKAGLTDIFSGKGGSR